MWLRSLPRQRAGRPLQARLLNQMAEAGEWAGRIRVDPPLQIVTAGFGPLLSYNGMVFEEWIAITASPFSPRSGGTPGTGTVILQTWDGRTLADLPQAAPVAAFNFSAAAGGIPAGLYCLVSHLYDDWWITTVECGPTSPTPTPTPTGTLTPALARAAPESPPRTGPLVPGGSLTIEGEPP